MKYFCICYVMPTTLFGIIQAINMDAYLETLTKKQWVAIMVTDLLLLVGMIVGGIVFK